jgi:hypothetical protein
MKAESCIQLFNRSIADYHVYDDVNRVIHNPFPKESIEALMYLKNWIDTVQWHYEDIIRDPHIDPQEGMELKRKIDASNQHRTDVVEQLDDYYSVLFKGVSALSSSKINTESPGWVVDRISILCLKIYHMEEQVNRKDVDDLHLRKCSDKLAILREQQTDIIQSFNDLLNEFAAGSKRIKVYRQMKMYNDASTNPVLYKK